MDVVGVTDVINVVDVVDVVDEVDEVDDSDLYSIIIPSFPIMFIHVQFGSERGDYVMEFEKKCFITAFDILEKVRYICGTCSTLRLYNDHGLLLETSHLVEKAMTYRVKRQSK